MHYFSKIVTFSSAGLLFLLLAATIAAMRPPEKSTISVGRVKFAVEIADRSFEWQRGLIGHQPLEDGEGMLFVFPTAGPRTFWMKDMSFPIDIVWIRDGAVIGFVDHAPPDDGSTFYRSPGPVDYVLEMAAGERLRLGFAVGSPVRVE